MRAMSLATCSESARLCLCLMKLSITGSEVAGQGTNERVNNVNTPAQWSIIKRGN